MMGGVSYYAEEGIVNVEPRAPVVVAVVVVVEYLYSASLSASNALIVP